MHWFYSQYRPLHKKPGCKNASSGLKKTKETIQPRLSPSMGSRVVVSGTPWHFVTRCIFAFRVEIFCLALLLLVSLLLRFLSDNVQQDLQGLSLIRIPDRRKLLRYTWYLYIFCNKRVKHICVPYPNIRINDRVSCWVLRSCLFITRIVIVVLAIRHIQHDVHNVHRL